MNDANTPNRKVKVSKPFDAQENSEVIPPPNGDSKDSNLNQGVENNDHKTADSKDSLDPFDPEHLRMSQNFDEDMCVEKQSLTIPSRKPSKEWWIQVHPDEKYRLHTGVLELKEDREIYLVERKLWPALSTETTFSPRMLFTAITRQGTLFLWPIRLPGTDGKIDTWNQSAIEAANIAMGCWIRVIPNMPAGGYDIIKTGTEHPEPKWPDLPFNEILRIAFKYNLISESDHPVLRRLRGEI